MAHATGPVAYYNQPPLCKETTPYIISAEKTRNKRKKTAMRLYRLSTLILLCVICALPLGKANGVSSPLKNGTGDSKVANQTPLQMHASFFDRDKDGIIYVTETYQGLRAIGCNVGISVAASLFINAALSSTTKPPESSSSPNLPIYIENIYKGKHGSDTGAYDSTGRFVPEKFEQIFSKYAKTKPNALSSKEVDNMLEGNRKAGDTKGQIGSQSEWKLLYNLAKDKDGFLQKDIIKGVYDGSLFYKMEMERSSLKKKS